MRVVQPRFRWPNLQRCRRSGRRIGHEQSPKARWDQGRTDSSLGRQRLSGLSQVWPRREMLAPLRLDSAWAVADGERLWKLFAREGAWGRSRSGSGRERWLEPRDLRKPRRELGAPVWASATLPVAHGDGSLPVATVLLSH